MHKIIKLNLVFLFLILNFFHIIAAPLTKGAGSTAMEALMSKWIRNYFLQQHKQIEYQAVGSGVGLKFLHDKKFDFAISDMPCNNNILIKQHWTQFPIAISQLDIIYNLPSISESLVLSAEVTADIFMHRIKKWNDPKIRALNPSLKLPNKKIIIVYRANESGTTYTLSHFLSQASDEWAQLYGSSLVIDKLPKTALGTGTDKILAETVKTLPYSIGYTNDVYAISERVSRVEFINKTGNLVLPEKLYAYAALANHRVYANSEELLNNLTNLPGIHSWPIIETSFVIIPKNSKKIVATLNFFYWALTSQGAVTDKLGYIPIPQRFSEKIFALWNKYYAYVPPKKVITNRT